MKRLVLLGLAISGAAACGDDSGDGSTIDARVIDAVSIDADNTDAPPAVTHGGSISLLEAAVLNPGNSGTFFGQGVQIGISFTASDVVPGPVLEEMPGSALGCKVWEYTPAQTAALIGIDEGPVQVTSALAGSISYPQCAFTAGVGYACPHANTAGNTGAIAVVAAGSLASLTVTGDPYSVNNTTNRYVRIAGATTAANNGVFPIVQRVNGNTIVYGNPGAVAEALPAAGLRVNLAGVGPTPQAPDPAFLLDAADFSFALTAGGAMNFDSFTSTTGVGTVGDDFTLAVGELNKLNAIPRNGAEFSVTCDATGCPAGSAAGTVLNIVTTDAPTAGLSPFTLPPPVTKRVQIRCGALGASAITVPAAYSAHLMTSGATRIQATFIRAALMGGGPAEVSAISGHAIVGFSNPP